jgi:ABC-type Fe3+/spermidine/putrescine transport system ATPase subunit
MHEMIPGAALAGEVLLAGQDIYHPSQRPQQVRSKIGMVFQKPNPFPTMSIYDSRRDAAAIRGPAGPAPPITCTGASADVPLVIPNEPWHLFTAKPEPGLGIEFDSGILGRPGVCYVCHDQLRIESAA